MLVFDAQCDNVRQLESAYHATMRQINGALRKKNSTGVFIETRQLALIYSAWSEASLVKVVHTPHCLDDSERSQVLSSSPPLSIEEKWHKFLDLALRKVEMGSGEVANIRKRLEGIIATYIVGPSRLRNKIAHGQWHFALNRDCLSVNAELTTQLGSLDAVEVDRWFRVHKELCLLADDLLESPNRAFQRDRWVHLVKVESIIKEMSRWTIESKLDQLLRKPIRTGKQARA